MNVCPGRCDWHCVGNERAHWTLRLLVVNKTNMVDRQRFCQSAICSPDSMAAFDCECERIGGWDSGLVALSACIQCMSVHMCVSGGKGWGCIQLGEL